MIQQLIFYVTSRCNLGCRDCFFRLHLNRGQDWTLAEINRIAFQLPKVQSILLTGGEPFMRTDLMEVLDAIKRNQPSVAVNINTNGTFPQRVETITSAYLKTYPQPLGVSVSLDGKRELHNHMRTGDGYDLALETIARLARIKERRPQLYFAVNSLLTPATIDALPEVIVMLADRFPLDYHNVELARGQGAAKERISAEKLRHFYVACLKLIKARYPAAYELSRARFELQYNAYVHNEPWGFPCHAGSGSVVLYPDGALSACELRASCLNIKDYAYNLASALQSDAMQAEVGRIQKTACACTHACWLLTSMFDYLDRKYGQREYGRIPEHSGHRSLSL